jgi:hypothetical protein
MSEKDKYTGMREFNFAPSTNVYICAFAGIFLGAILGYWATGSIEITIASAITISLLSGIFGMFV